MKVESPLLPDGVDGHPEPNDDQVPYQFVIDNYYRRMYYFIFCLVSEQQTATVLAKAAFKTLFQPMVKAAEMETLKNSLYKMSGLLVMAHLHGISRQEEKYEEYLPELVRLKIQTEMLSGHLAE